MGTKLSKPSDQLTWYTQRNNYFNPLITCFPTSNAQTIYNNKLEAHPKADVLMGACIDDVFSMLCNTPGVGQKIAKKYNIQDSALNLYWTVEQDVARFFLNGFSFDNVHGANEAVKYFEDATLDSIKCEIDNGYAVVVGIPIRANKSNSIVGGHVLTMCGYKDDGSGVFLDPYGNWNTWYADPNGNQVVYPKDVVDNWIGKQGKFRCMFIHSDLTKVG